jgi:hypothetical protein
MAVIEDQDVISTKRIFENRSGSQRMDMPENS